MNKKISIKRHLILAVGLLFVPTFAFSKTILNCNKITERLAAKGWELVGASDMLIHHRVNSQKDLTKFLYSSAEIAEGDVLLSDTGKWIMGHPPQTKSDLSFRDWITAIYHSGKKAKIDIKDPGAVPHIIEVLNELGMEGRRLILNADIVELSNKIVVSEADLALLRQAFPRALLSIGLTLNGEAISSSLFHKKILELRDVAERLGGQITFTLPASHVKPETVEALASTLEGRNLSFFTRRSDDVDADTAEAFSRMVPHAFMDIWDKAGEPIHMLEPWNGKRRKAVHARTIQVKDITQWILQTPNKDVLERKGIAPLIVADLDGTLWRSNRFGPWVVSLARERGMFTDVPRKKLDELLSRLGLEPQHLQRPDKGVGRDFLRAWNTFIQWKKDRPKEKVNEMTFEMEAMYGWILAGIPVRNIHRLVDEVVEKHHLKDMVFKGVHDLIQQAGNKGLSFAVVSTNPEVIAQRVAKVVFNIPPEFTKGTRIGIKDGILTTEVERVTHREGKAEAVVELIGQVTSEPTLPSKVFLTMGDSPHHGDSHLIPMGVRAIVPEPTQDAVIAGLQAENISFLSYGRTEGNRIASDFSKQIQPLE